MALFVPPSWSACASRSKCSFASIFADARNSFASAGLTGLAYSSAGLRDLRARLFRWRVGLHWYAVARPTALLLMMKILCALSLMSPVYIPTIYDNRPFPEQDSHPRFSRYAMSCGLLLLPILAWNAVFTNTLMPPSAMTAFWRDIPAPLVWLENVFRYLVIVLPFAMPLRIATRHDWRALLVFVLGTLVYFISWLALIYWPNSVWASSIYGSLAPAYTPIIWLTGLAMLGDRLFWGHFYHWWMYLILSVSFLATHIAHGALVYFRST